MKKYLLLLTLLVSSLTFGQVNTSTVKAGKYQMNIPESGSAQDSVVVWDPATKMMKIVSTSSLQAKSDLQYIASPTNGQVKPTIGTSAILPLASGTNAGLLSPIEKIKLSGIAEGATDNQGTVYDISAIDGIEITNPTTNPTLGLGDITPLSTNGVTAETMQFLDVTSSVQTQIDQKANIIHSLSHEQGGTDVIQGENLSVNVIPPTNNYSPVTSTLKGHLQGIDQALGLVQSTLVSGTTIKTIEGQSILGSGNIDITKSDVGLPLADNTSDASKSVLSSTKLTTPRSINGVNFDGTSNIAINAVDSTPRIAVSEKAQANGVATLGSDGKIPNSQIPALAISETFPISSQAQMLGLSQADQGDVAIRSDISKSFILRQSPSSVLANWSELLSPTDAVTSVNGQVGVVNLTTANINDTTNKRYQTDAQQANNNATSPIQQQIDSKQSTLVSGTTIKTIEGQNILGSGNIDITKTDVGLALVPNTDFTAAVAANTAKVGITPTQASNITANNAKISFDATSSARLANTSGTNTGDNAVNILYSGIVSNATHTGDVTGSTALTLATVNSNVGTFGNASNSTTQTVNAKGLTTAISNVPIQIAESQVTGLVSGLAGKEPSFSKNTAFNKNFGTTVGTVAEGNDARLSDSRNPLPNSSNYIQNQNTSAQSANMWISGTGKFGSSVTAIRFNLEDTNDVFFSNPFNNWSIKASASENSLNFIDNQFGVTRLSFSGATTTFSSTVTAPTFIGNLSGNATSATNWGNSQADFGSYAAAPSSWLAGYDSTTNKVKPWDVTQVRTYLGLGSNAYSSTAFAPLNGTGASGTWGINISGKAGDTQQWRGYENDWNSTVHSDNPDYLLTATGAVASKNTVGSIQSWLGLGSNAYSSTAYLGDKGRLGINKNANLNMSIGAFDVFSNDIPSEWSNFPDNNYGTLVVFKAENSVTQLYGNNSNEHYIRTQYSVSSLNRTWRKLWHDGNFNPANYLPLSGGTLSGGLTIGNAFNVASTNDLNVGEALRIGSNANYVYIDGSGAINKGGSGFTFGNSISGISANFSSSVTATSLDLTTGSILLTGGGPGTSIKTVATSANTTTLEFYTNYGNNAPIKALSLYNGAATFSSTVTASPATLDTQLATLGQVKGITDGKFDKTGGTISGNVSVTGTVTASGGFFNSDIRLKHIFKRDGDVAYYTWKDGRDNKQHIGYVAQEVQENHPNQVQADEKGILSVNYVEILVEKIRVLEKRIEQLEKSK